MGKENERFLQTVHHGKDSLLRQRVHCRCASLAGAELAGHQGPPTEIWAANARHTATNPGAKIRCAFFWNTVDCAAAAAITALAGKTSAQALYIAAVARAFWPRHGSNDRCWPEHEIVQQPVMPFRQKSAIVLEKPDYIGCFQFFTF